jgi:hypothetical protein
MPILTTIGNAAARGFGFGTFLSLAGEIYKKFIIAVKNDSIRTYGANQITCATFNYASNYVSSPTNTNNNLIAYTGVYMYTPNGTSGQPKFFGDMAIVPGGVGTTLPYQQVAIKQFTSTSPTSAMSFTNYSIVPGGVSGFPYLVFGIFTSSSPTNYGSAYVGYITGNMYSTFTYTNTLGHEFSGTVSSTAVGNSVGYNNHYGSFSYVAFSNANSAFTNGYVGNVIPFTDSTTTNNGRSFSRINTNWKTPTYINGSCCVNNQWLGSGSGSYGLQGIGFCLPIVNVADTKTYIVTGLIDPRIGFNYSQIALYNSTYSIGNPEAFERLSTNGYADMPLRKANYITADLGSNHYISTVVKGASTNTPVICVLDQFCQTLNQTWEYTSTLTDLVVFSIDYIPYLNSLYVQFGSASVRQPCYVAKIGVTGASKGVVSWIKKFIFGTNLSTTDAYVSAKISFNQTGNYALVPGAIWSGSLQESALVTYALDGSQDGTTIYFDGTNNMTCTAESSSVFALSTTTSTLISTQSFTSLTYASTDAWNLSNQATTTTGYGLSNTTQSTYTY